jgi:hypothetical protein
MTPTVLVSLLNDAGISFLKNDTIELYITTGSVILVNSVLMPFVINIMT